MTTPMQRYSADYNHGPATPRDITRDPTNRFVQITEHYGRRDREFQSKEFVAAVADHLPGATLGEEGERLIVDGKIILYFHPSYGAKMGRVRVCAGSGLLQPYRAMPTAPALPSCTVDAGRDLVTVARDIQRRVVDPSGPIIQGMRAAAEQYDREAEEFAAWCRSVEEQIPGIEITIRASGDEASFSLSTTKGSVSGTLYASGSVRLGRTSWQADFCDFAKVFLDYGGSTPGK